MLRLALTDTFLLIFDPMAATKAANKRHGDKPRQIVSWLSCGDAAMGRAVKWKSSRSLCSAVSLAPLMTSQEAQNASSGDDEEEDEGGDDGDSEDGDGSGSSDSEDS